MENSGEQGKESSGSGGGSASTDDGLERENEDLRTASSQNENIVMELDMSCKVQFISKCWEDIVG